MLRRGKAGDTVSRRTMAATCDEHAEYHVAPYSKVGRCQ